jgi:hypothetical protein
LKADGGTNDRGKRAEVLFAIAATLREHAEELAQSEMVNIGKPIVDARDEMALGARIFEYYAGAIGKFFRANHSGWAGWVRLYASTAARSGGGNRSVEFPIPHRLLESSAGVGSRQLRCSQAGHSFSNDSVAPWGIRACGRAARWRFADRAGCWECDR